MLYSLVDTKDLFVSTVDTETLSTWAKQNTKRSIFNGAALIPTPNDYAISLGYKSIQVINPPTPTPVAGCWRWCNNTWKLNDEASTFPTELVLTLRQKAYKKESDGLKLNAEFDALINNTAVDYTLWIAAKQRIRSNYPIPDSCKTT